MELRHVVPIGAARVVVKLESHYPTGSMKDRMALAVIQGAVARGDLPQRNSDTLPSYVEEPRGRVVEYTGGSTGTSLAFVCAAMGYDLSIVTSDAFSREKRDHMRALGADVLEIPSEGGRTTKELIQRMITKATELGAQPGSFLADQFNNPDAAAGYAPVADEIMRQCNGNVDAFVQAVGTAQCMFGIAGRWRQLAAQGRIREMHIVALEPSESAVLSGGLSGAHKIEGVGPGFVPPMWSADLADEIQQVSTAEAQAMAQRLAREEALFAGTSTGANVVAAIRVAQRLGAGKTVATLACDSGHKYLSTNLYRSQTFPSADD